MVRHWISLISPMAGLYMIACVISVPAVAIVLIARILLKQRRERMAKRPELCIYPNCFECPYRDCIVDGIFPGELEDGRKASQNDKYKKITRKRRKRK